MTVPAPRRRHPLRPWLIAAAQLVAATAGAAAEIVIAPGDPIQSAVDAHPPGTVFRLAAGIHRGQSVVPKPGDAFIGEPGAVLDGGDAVEYAFLGDVPDPPADVRIAGLVIQRYAPPLHFGAVRAGGHGEHQGGAGWTVEACEIRDNLHAAIRTGDRMRVLRNHLHDNGWNGLIGTGDDVLIEGNEVDGNNTRRLADGGGGKLVATERLVIRGNFSHHNHGPGLWTDINNRDTLYEANVIEDNDETGIFHEISYRATIRGNFLARNGARSEWLNGAGVVVAESPDVEVAGNTVLDCRMGITAIQQVRGEPAKHGPHVLEHLRVHHNLVRMRGGFTGIGQDVPDGASYFSTRDNRFDRNTYVLGALAAPFHWSVPGCDEGTWREFGNDQLGVFDRSAEPGDLAAPVVAVTAPSTASTVSGRVTLAALARDDVGVVAVRFLVDGAPIAEVAAAPYTATWDAGAAAPGPHRITADAGDAAGHRTESPAVPVVVAPAAGRD